LFVTLGAVVVRISVLNQSTYPLFTLPLYLLLDALFGRSATALRASVASTLLAMGGIGAILALRFEEQARASFWQARRIRSQIEELAREKARSEELLLNVLPPAIAERLKSEPRAIADGFPRVSVLFADIVGFTRM